METLSYSRIRTWKRCRRKWYYSYQENLKPKARVAKMDLGSFVHALLENLYGDNLPLKEASEKYFSEIASDSIDPELMEHFREIQETAEIIAARYQKHYADIDHWEILGVEQEYIVDIPETDIKLKMIVDLLVKDVNTGEIWIVDHKVTSIGFDDWKESLVLDEQANTYIWALKSIGIPVSGVIFNLVRSKIPRTPAALKSGGLSQAKNIDTDYNTYVAAILAGGYDLEDYSEILCYIEDHCKSFFGRFLTYRTPEEVHVIEQELITIAKEYSLLSNDENLMPVRTANSNCRWDCPFMQLCIMESKLLDTSICKELEYERK